MKVRCTNTLIRYHQAAAVFHRYPKLRDKMEQNLQANALLIKYIRHKAQVQMIDQIPVWILFVFYIQTWLHTDVAMNQVFLTFLCF